MDLPRFSIEGLPVEGLGCTVRNEFRNAYSARYSSSLVRTQGSGDSQQALVIDIAMDEVVFRVDSRVGQAVSKIVVLVKVFQAKGVLWLGADLLAGFAPGPGAFANLLACKAFPTLHLGHFRWIHGVAIGETRVTIRLIATFAMHHVVREILVVALMAPLLAALAV